MKKGFTLAELLGVITLLAIICLIAFPPILNTIKKGKQNIDNTNNEIIFSACKKYIENNPTEVSFVDNKYCVKIQSLIDEGNLMDGLKDPDTGVAVDPEKYISVTVTDNKFNYSMAKKDEC